MTSGCVAIVSPREERRNSARAWAPLLQGRAEVQLCARPEDASGANVLALDAEIEDLDAWLSRWTAEGGPQIVVFAGASNPPAGSLPWGRDGEEILAVISDLLDRRVLLQRSDEIRDSLLASSGALASQQEWLRQATAEVPAQSAPDARALSRDVDRLTRLASISRFLAAPGSDGPFPERLCEVVARALGVPGLALARRGAGAWHVEGSWRVAPRTAAKLLRSVDARTGAVFDLPSGSATRRGFALSWRDAAGDRALVGTALPGRDPSVSLEAEGLAELTGLLADALAARDATAAQLQRKSLSERAVQTLRSGLLKIDARGHVLLVNPALAEILEADASEMEGRPIAEALPRDPHVVELLRAALLRDEPLDDVETFVTSAGGRRVPVSLRASRLGASASEGLLVLLSDLARRKELEEEIRKAERLAALGRLSAGVAHEIRNPLAGIRTTAELLKGRVASDSDLTRFVDVILEEAERLDRIVGSLLQFARPSPPKRQPVRSADLLDRARKLAASRAAERGVAVRAVESRDLPEPEADRDQILQVLLNLVLNAIDATPAGGEVVLRTEADDREIRFVIEDGGEGVPDGLRERVFDPFFTTKPGGTGLGLSISQNILRQHGGRLRLERPDGGASRAVASLPRHPPSKVHALPGGATWRTS